ncbi:MAG: class I SAM-dependent methyltransferase [Verrucomicrobiales bacterium]|nr:class I SAM-dependent methyltransferase [Verrucomicrobiales bacterium]
MDTVGIPRTSIASDTASARAQRLARLYPRPFMRSYAYWKTRTDPVYERITQELHQAEAAPLLDLGCGAGLFPIYLRQSNYTGPIRGLDLSVRKIDLARRISAQHHLGLEFVTGDFAHLDASDHQGHVTLLDVLQFVEIQVQEHILRQTAACLTEPGHRLILRNALRDDSWRSRVTVGIDHFSHWIRWMPSSPSHHPDRVWLEQLLIECGLTPRFVPLWGATPFNNFLVIAARE